MSNVDTMDLVEREDRMNIDGLLGEWESLIDELSSKEIALYEWKHVYQAKAMEIENTVDFKKLYGANNQKIRDQHVRNELQTWADNIKELEFSINYLARRISFIKEMIKCKRVLYYKEYVK